MPIVIIIFYWNVNKPIIMKSITIIKNIFQ